MSEPIKSKEGTVGLFEGDGIAIGSGGGGGGGAEVKLATITVVNSSATKVYVSDYTAAEYDGAKYVTFNANAIEVAAYATKTAHAPYSSNSIDTEGIVVVAANNAANFLTLSGIVATEGYIVSKNPYNNQSGDQVGWALHVVAYADENPLELTVS